VATKTVNIWEALESKEGVELFDKLEEFIRQHMTVVNEPDPEDFCYPCAVGQIREIQEELNADAAAEREYIAATFLGMAENLGCLNELKEIVRRK